MLVLAFFDVGSEASKTQIRRQASFAYHAMYGCNANSIKATDHNDKPLNGRCGIIVGYEKTKKEFIVRLVTKRVSEASQFEVEVRNLSPSYLE